jgi:hypothetical protein
MTGEGLPHSPLACPRGGYRKNNFGEGWWWWLSLQRHYRLCPSSHKCKNLQSKISNLLPMYNFWKGSTISNFWKYCYGKEVPDWVMNLDRKC